MGFLRQATASQSRAIGPFLDDTDFKSAESGLTIANTDIKLVINGAASVNKNSGGGTHRVNGVYGITFDATDTATVGEIDVSVFVSGALPVFDKYTVLEEAVYDALFAGSAPGYLQPTVAGRTLDVSAGGEAGIDWANIGSPTSAVNLSATNIDVDQVVASVSGNVGGSVASVVGLTASNLDATISSRASATNLATVAGYIDTEVAAIQAVTTKLDTALEADGGVYRFTANALEQAPTGGSAPTASAIADEVQTRTIAAVTLVNGLAANSVTASALASDAVTEIQSGLATSSALSTISGKIDTIDDFLDTEVAAIKAKTDLIPASPAATGDIPSVDDFWDEAVDGSTTARQSIRLANAALGGKASGLATTEATFRDLADTKDRLVATVDSDGNRTAITRDLT